MRVDCPLFGPLFDRFRAYSYSSMCTVSPHFTIVWSYRSFTVLNIAHPTQKLFISKSLALSAADQTATQARESSYRGSRPASIYVAFSVSNIPLARSQRQSHAQHSSKHSKPTTTAPRWRHQLQLAYMLEDVLPRASLSHRMALNRFLPNTINALRRAIKQF